MELLLTGCASCSDDDLAQANDDHYCIDGRIYGFCSDAHCGGICEPFGLCECECHVSSERSE